jgi:predicted MPP superfamily phosphohydrolase
MDDPKPSKKKPSAKFLRANLRHKLFTKGADKLLGGRLSKAHAEQEVIAREFEIPLAGWPKAFDGLRIGHLTDIHYGDLMKVEQAVAAVDLLAAQKPDIVCFTGDMIDLHCEGAEPIFAALTKVNAPLGAFMVMGNHDYLDDGERVRAMARAAGVTVLDESVERFERDGEELRVAGIDWDRTVKGLRARVRRVAPEKPHLLLAHNPKAFLSASEEGIPLTIAGHTHGGQIARPGKPNVNLAVAHRLSAGLYERGESALFVSVGVGAWFPLRVHCPAEVVLITARSG